METIPKKVILIREQKTDSTTTIHKHSPAVHFEKQKQSITRAIDFILFLFLFYLFFFWAKRVKNRKISRLLINTMQVEA